MEIGKTMEGRLASKRLGELLVQENVVNFDQLQQAKKEQKQHGGRLGTALVKLGYIDEGKLTDFLSEQYNVPAIDLNIFEIDPAAISKVPRNICEKHICIPISVSEDNLVVAMADPTNIFVLDDLRFISKCKIEAVVATETAILQSVAKYYSSSIAYESVMSDIEEESVANTQGTGPSIDDIVTVDDDKSSKEDVPVIKFINMLLAEAIKLKASDIHIEPYEKSFRVRFRVDGTLVEKIKPPQGISGAISSRLKIMARLDISERRRPQDGRLKVKTKNGFEIDFRVSVLPVLFGEKIVMRLLDKTNLQLDMTHLGFEQGQLDRFKNSIHKPFGMVLITGPTGSGKSTTIYSALAELNRPNVNISTAEDPVEFNLEGINQVQMNSDVGLDFASSLRSFLRQDPDIIMVGEIRDYETAEVAFKAALTGHLVVSTLHTNDAPSTINRLVNMGVEPFMIVSAVNCVVAQRLVRQICKSCKSHVHVEPQQLIEIGVPEAQAVNAEIFKGQGCTACNGTGYKGRIAIHEVMEFTERLKQGLFEGLSPIEFKKLAIDDGMQSMRESAINKMLKGLTTVDEVLATSVGGE